MGKNNSKPVDYFVKQGDKTTLVKWFCRGELSFGFRRDFTIFATHLAG
jgi:hypothetical protein